MTDFSATTAFRLVRRLAAAGRDVPSAYLLVCEAATIDAVQADIVAEVQVQLGFNLRSLAASQLRPRTLDDAFTANGAWAVVLMTLDHWVSKLVDSLDRNIAFFTGTGTVLLLASHEIAERALAAAPNLRNRLTDILAITPEEASGGESA
jgi:hypothetical protein